MEFMKANEYAILQLQSDDTASAIKINVTRFQHSSEALLQESGNMSDESSISVMAVQGGQESELMLHCCTPISLVARPIRRMHP